MHRVPRVTGRSRAFPAAVIAAMVSLVFPSLAAARPVRVHAFNVAPGSAFTVQINASGSSAVASSAAGSIVVGFDAMNGDRIGLVPDVNLQPPPPPLLSSAELVSPSCVQTAWLPGGDPTIVGYVVCFGTRSVAAGQAAAYDHTVNASSFTSHTICSLGATTYFFAVRARNYLGMLSAYSAEKSVTVSVLPVLITRFEAAPEQGAVRLSWSVFSDETIRGFRVYRASAGGPELPHSDLLDAGATAWADTSVNSATTYTYVLGAVKDNGEEVRSIPVTATTPALVFALGPNVPNPFRNATRIPFTLDEAQRVVLRVYDVRGARVATVFDGTLPEGTHTMSWSGHDDHGEKVASGTYFCALTAGKRTVSRKMALVR